MKFNQLSCPFWVCGFVVVGLLGFFLILILVSKKDLLPHLKEMPQVTKVSSIKIRKAKLDEG